VNNLAETRGFTGELNYSQRENLLKTLEQEIQNNKLSVEDAVQIMSYRDIKRELTTHNIPATGTEAQLRQKLLETLQIENTKNNPITEDILSSSAQQTKETDKPRNSSAEEIDGKYASASPEVENGSSSRNMKLADMTRLLNEKEMNKKEMAGDTAEWEGNLNAKRTNYYCAETGEFIVLDENPEESEVDTSFSPSKTARESEEHFEASLSSDSDNETTVNPEEIEEEKMTESDDKNIKALQNKALMYVGASMVILAVFSMFT